MQQVALHRRVGMPMHGPDHRAAHGILPHPEALLVVQRHHPVQGIPTPAAPAPHQLQRPPWQGTIRSHVGVLLMPQHGGQPLAQVLLLPGQPRATRGHRAREAQLLG